MGLLNRVLIAGGSGQIGTLLAKHFRSRGDAVHVLSRINRSAPWPVTQWDGRNPGAWTKLLENTDTLINLSGRSVNCRYTKANREEILRSRVDSTKVLGEQIALAASPPRLWLNASTATIYRHALDRPMDEILGELGGNEPNVPDTWCFSIEVAKAWEEAFFHATTPRTRKIALRSALTLTPGRSRESVMGILTILVQGGLGGTSGSGDQFVSWIHHTDFLRAIDFLIEREDLDGAINIASPNPVANRDFMAGLRTAMRQPTGLSATEWMLEIGAFLMKTETELLLKSRRVVPTRLLKAGFDFHFPNWPEAAKDLTK